MSQVRRLISVARGTGLRACTSLTLSSVSPPSMAFVSYSVLPSSETFSPCANSLSVSSERGAFGLLTSTAMMPWPPPIQKVLPSGENPLSWPYGPAR